MQKFSEWLEQRDQELYDENMRNWMMRKMAPYGAGAALAIGAAAGLMPKSTPTKQPTKSVSKKIENQKVTVSRKKDEKGLPKEWIYEFKNASSLKDALKYAKDLTREEQLRMMGGSGVVSGNTPSIVSDDGKGNIVIKITKYDTSSIER